MGLFDSPVDTSGALNQINGGFGGLSSGVGTAQGLGGGQNGLLNYLMPMYQGSLSQANSLLSMDPRSQAYTNMQLAPAYQATDQAVAAGKSALTSDLAGRGMLTSSTTGAPGAYVGGLTALQNAGTAAKSNVAAGVARNNATLPLQYAMQRAGLLGGATQNAFGNALGANGQALQGSMDQGQLGLGLYGNQVQQNMANSQGWGQLLGGLGSLAGSYMGLQGMKALAGGGSGGGSG